MTYFNHTTREYNYAEGTRTAVGATSSAAVSLGVLNPNTREVRILASSRCFIRFGTSAVADATVGAGQLEIPADLVWHERIPVGATHFKVIRDSADGFVNVTPVF